MDRRIVAGLAAVLLLVAGCAEEPEPPPSIADQTASNGADSDDGTEPAVAGTQVQRGSVTRLGDVRIGLYSVVTETLAQLSIDTPDETVENTELDVGDAVEVGGYTLTLTEAGTSFARVQVVGPDGAEVTR